MVKNPEKVGGQKVATEGRSPQPPEARGCGHGPSLVLKSGGEFCVILKSGAYGMLARCGTLQIFSVMPLDTLNLDFVSSAIFTQSPLFGKCGFKLP